MRRVLVATARTQGVRANDEALCSSLEQRGFDPVDPLDVGEEIDELSAIAALLPVGTVLERRLWQPRVRVGSGRGRGLAPG